MNTVEKVQTWKWRITKAGFTIAHFADEIEIARPQFYTYINGQHLPTLQTYDKVEAKLKELGV